MRHTADIDLLEYLFAKRGGWEIWLTLLKIVVAQHCF